ncbi:MAG: prolyl oligopeptidase family serine peptidase, partial [Halobaculum sp.]
EEAAELDRREEGGPIQIDRLQHKADGVGWLDEVTTYLFVCDAAGEPSDADDARRLDDAYGAGAREPLFGLQPAWGAGGRIAFGSNRTERPDDSGAIDLYTIGPDGDDCRQVTEGLRTSGYAWGPDGERVAFGAGDPKNWYVPTELRVASGEDHHSVTGSLDRTLAREATPAWLDDETLLVAVADEGHTRLVTASADRDDPERTFPAQTRDRTLTAADADGGRVATVLSEQATGVDAYTVASDELADDDPASLTRVTRFGERFGDDRLPTCRRVTYENRDGEGIEAVVHLPPDFDPETDDPRPVIASIHGGPMSYDAPEFGFTYTYWASRGYVVYRPNYRGSTSYGRAFAESLRGTRGDLETDDVSSGLDALADRGWVDPDRTLVTGFSYGGITTANVVTRSNAFTVAAAEHGVYDFRSTFGTDDNHLWHDWEFGLPWDEPERYEEISSITDVDRVETPILLTAGEHDWRCPLTQAEQFHVSVKKRGVPARLVVYQNEHHNVDDPDRAIHRLRTLTDWFEEHADLDPPASDTAESSG